MHYSSLIGCYNSRQQPATSNQQPATSNLEHEVNEALTILTLTSALALFIVLPIVEMLRTGDDSMQRKADNTRCAALRVDENAKRLADRAAAEKSLERFNRAQKARAALRNRYNT